MRLAYRLFHTVCWRSLVALLLLTLSAASKAPAVEHGVLSEDVVKAALIYNFAKFVEWPATSFADPKSPLNLCIYREANNELRQALSVFQGKTAQGHEIQIRSGIQQKDLAGCQVLYIPETQGRWLPEVLRSAHAQQVLTVSDMDDFIDAGGIIELLTIEGQQRFAINLDAAQRANLRISAQLLKLAKSVKGPTGKR